MTPAQRVLNQVAGWVITVIIFIPFWILVGIHNGIENLYTWAFDRSGK
jgi:hypothetical protein